MQNKEESKKEKEAVKSEEINTGCPCDEPNCPRHGKCMKCQAYHRKHPECGQTACGK